MNKREKYIPDLRELHSLAEKNYAGLARIVPRGNNERVIQVGEHSQFFLSVKNEAAYTTDIQIKQSFNTDNVPLVVPVEFIARLYHDAKMAEIIDCQGATALTSIRPGKAPKRAQEKDEKRQLSRLLSDWLRLCSQQGRIAVSIS
ncbi:MAG: hypothetical protein HLUCCO02_00475 [Idiomarinaceae bacterium HL-53]|nr:MAG: hypothetical protein HLUCCO02_00475 [Idiomarinaceae bacterium HL-53]CUS48511.1 Uncharacterized protein YqiB, DUF1249 family [Idiomarinaceae bacterium HL-53]